MTTSLPPSEPDIEDILKGAEARHFTAEEVDRLLALAPDLAPRLRAAQEVASVERTVVRDAVTEVLALYPFDTREWSHAKCTRDVTTVSAYATLAMVRDDLTWFDNKVLLWLRTILHAFEFPAKSARARPVMFKRSTGVEDRPAGVHSIYDTYSRLRDGYRRALSPDAWRLMEPALQRVLDTLV